MTPCRGCGQPTPEADLSARGSWRCLACRRAVARRRAKASYWHGKDPDRLLTRIHYRSVPKASPERLAELARELEQMRPCEVRCSDCGRRFEENFVRKPPAVLFCPPCIERRVAKVLAER